MRLTRVSIIRACSPYDVRYATLCWSLVLAVASKQQVSATAGTALERAIGSPGTRPVEPGWHPTDSVGLEVRALRPVRAFGVASRSSGTGTGATAPHAALKPSDARAAASTTGAVRSNTGARTQRRSSSDASTGSRRGRFSGSGARGTVSECSLHTGAIERRILSGGGRSNDSDTHRT